MKKYRLMGRSKETGNTWYGKPVYSSYEMAADNANKLMQEAPYLIYQVEAVDIEENKASNKE